MLSRTRLIEKEKILIYFSMFDVARYEAETTARRGIRKLRVRMVSNADDKAKLGEKRREWWKTLKRID